MPTYTRSLADDLRQDSDIHFRLVDNVAFLMIDRQPENNRLTPASLAHIAQIAQTLAVDPRTNCVVVSAEGVEHFSSGIFNAELRAGYSKEDILAIVKLANDAFDGLQALPQIVIGALNGAVRAGGGELALACDFRLCADHASLAFHETSYGCFPGAGAPVRLTSIVGAGRALEIMATGREVAADEMLRIGLVTEIVPSGKLQAHASGIAAQIAAKGPLGLRGAKRVAQLQVSAGDAAAHQLSWALRTSLEYSYDVDEALVAFREKRKASYLGR
ncbi:enoyl-CoA hydratase/isomerase family protein [Variovorax paradoxus]|uniref:enoyl-CoA hydratase/isomerase family protein n=1 Tax=Variovorax paradoxus TaxID=34073 RepID=UPI0019349E7A|nr:enoyl-CoA hydratase/isomerase family protein [Variovorax paradoxus]